MIVTILSNFDNRVGPRILIRYPNVRTDVYLDHIPLLMDLYKEGFFIHEFGEVKTANFIFETPSPIARGRLELLMVSIVSIEDQYADVMTAAISADIAEQLEAKRDVIYSALADEGVLATERVVAGEDLYEESRTVYTEGAVETTDFVATEEGVAGQHVVATDEMIAAEAFTVTEDAAAYAAGVATEEGAVVAGVVAVADESQPEQLEEPEAEEE